MKPAGLQKSGLPSKRRLSKPSAGCASRTCQPSNLATGGILMLSSAVLTIGPPCGRGANESLLTPCCQQLGAQPVCDDFTHDVRQRLAGERRNRHPAHAL